MKFENKYNKNIDIDMNQATDILKDFFIKIFTRKKGL